MSRAINLDLTEAAVRQACEDVDVQISVIELLEPSGVRLVCASTNGAATVRHKLRANVIDGPIKRSRIFEGGMQPYNANAPDAFDRLRRRLPSRDLIRR